MSVTKEFVVGFFISFIGSIPLGYLNIVGLEIYNQSTTLDLAFYLLGIVIIEGLVVFGTLQLVNKTTVNLNTKKAIALFSMLFLGFLSYCYYPSSIQTLHVAPRIGFNLYNFPILLGLVLSLLNFAQLPYWFSWNLYVYHNQLILVNNRNLVYVFGSMIGTFLGMLVLIISTKGLSKFFNFQFENYLWLLFLLLSVLQLRVFFKQKIGFLKKKDFNIFYNL